MSRRPATVALGELRDHLGAHVRRVRRGAELIVLDRGKAVARIVKYDAPNAGDAHLTSLIARGLARAPEAALDPRVLATVPDETRLPGNAAVEALLADRYDD